MGLVSKVKKFLGLSLTDEKAWNRGLWNLYGSQSISGENVTEETALTYSAVWNAVWLISRSIASLPLHLMQQQGKNKVPARGENLYYLLHDKPNPFMSAMTLREVMTAHILTWGNAYAEKLLDGIGEVRELWPIPPDRVLRVEMKADNNLWYEIRVDNETKWLSRDKILHIPGLGFDGFIGYSPNAMARKSIGLGMAEETFGAKYFGDGTHPGVIISHPGPGMSAQAHANLKQALTETYSGLGQSHRLMLLEEGMKIEKVTIPPNDSQFLESRQFQISDIARWFNLPVHKLKELSRSTNNNIEHQGIEYYVDTLLPWLVCLEQKYNMQLLTRQQLQAEKLYFKHNASAILRGDAKSRAEFYQIMKRNGLMTPNEIRELEDLNPHDDPLADELWTEANMWPLSQFDELKKQQDARLTEGNNPPVKALRLLKEGNR